MNKQFASQNSVNKVDLYPTFTINFVMSNDVQSGIFEDIINYFIKFGTHKYNYVISKDPIKDAHVYHYHRINVQKNVSHPSIVTVHHDLDDTDRWFRFENFYDKYLDVDKIICLNTNQKNTLEQSGFNPKKLFVIPHGVNDSVLGTPTKSALPNDKITLGIYSKRYGRRVKGEAYLYELSKRLDTNKFRFLLAGTDRTITANELRKFGFDCKAYDHFPYSLSRSFYAAIDVLLMCSFYEGGPANIPEAVATGTPICGSNIGMVTDFVSNNENGILLTMNPDIDAEVITSLYDNNYSKLNKLNLGARKARKNAITWQDVVNEHEKIYTKMIKKNLEQINAQTN